MDISFLVDKGDFKYEQLFMEYTRQTTGIIM